MKGQEIPEALLGVSAPVSGFAVVGNGYSIHDRFPSNAAIRTHLDGAGEATVMRAAGMVGDTILWRPEYVAVSRDRMRKAVNPNKDRDFAILVETTAQKVSRLTHEQLQTLMPNILARLDASWVALPPATRDQVLQRVLTDLQTQFPEIALGAAIVGLSLPIAITTIKGSAKAYPGMAGFTDAWKYGTADEEAANWIATASGNYVKNFQGKVHEGASQIARDAVAQGMKAGLTEAQIAAQLQGGIAGLLGQSSKNFGHMVASTFLSRARTWGQLASMGRAGFREYEIVAVLDESTCARCRWMHGQRFSVPIGLGMFSRRTGGQPAETWMKTRSLGPATGLSAIKVDLGGIFLGIAQETRSGVGARNDRGDWAAGPHGTPAKMQGLGVAPPPYHAECRCLTMPVFAL